MRLVGTLRTHEFEKSRNTNRSGRIYMLTLLLLANYPTHSHWLQSLAISLTDQFHLRTG